MDFFAVAEGEYGRVELVEQKHHLVMHAHPQTHIMLWIEGGMAHVRTGRQRVALNASQGLVMASHVSHDLRLDDIAKPAIILNVYLEDAWCDQHGAKWAQPRAGVHALLAITSALSQVTTPLLRHLMSSDRPTVQSIEADLTSLVAQAMVSAIDGKALRALPPRRPLIDYRLRLAIAHMNDNLGNPSVADDVADLVGLSRSRFFELFNQQLGTSPLVFWNAMRLEEALRRLNHGQEKLTSVALELGFSSPGNFARFFREHRGVTPSTYRRECNAY